MSGAGLTRRAVAALPFMAAASPLWAQPAQAKFALIIANADYDGDGRTDPSPEGVTRARERGFVGDLGNPWFDAVRVGDSLRAAGFEVSTVHNADRATMYGAIARLRARAAAAGPTAATVFYYAGHGVQLGGRSYLVATRARLDEAMPAETSIDRDRIGFAMGMSLQQMLAGARRPVAPGYELILLDACRDNPWEDQVRAAFAAEGRAYAGERAYAALSAPTDRTVIGFSAQPGQYAQDGYRAGSSPFANAIARGARRRGVPIDSLLDSVMGEVAAASGATQIPTVVGRLRDGTSLMP
ncbi:MAG: caspase family protein [Hyphomonadaceae bacterium]|nr:caspase family protein [Hyphomonadaceae bacterium]